MVWLQNVKLHYLLGVFLKLLKAEALNEESNMTKKGILGDSNPSTLIHTVYFLLAKHFALRSRDEHRSLRWGAASQIQIRGTPFLLPLCHVYSITNKKHMILDLL